MSTDGPPSITCPNCGMTSYNPNDVREGYCGHCHDFTGHKRNVGVIGAPDSGKTTVVERAQHAADPDYGAVLQEYLDLYANQPARQAELVVPAWALRRLNALTDLQRLAIMNEIDHIAALHGLKTPTKLIVAANER